MSNDKHYYEWYALLSICYLLKLDIDDFEHKDRPDLQSNINNIGIEVVRAITQEQGLTYSLINTYFGKGLSGEEIVKLIQKNNKKNKFKGTVSSVNGKAVISNTKELYDSDIHKLQVIEKIERKAKLFENYIKFKINGLYCFTQTGLINEKDYPDIIIACNNSPFDIVFINCINRILLWNKQPNCIIEHIISYDLLSKWDKEALNKYGI